MDHCYCK